MPPRQLSTRGLMPLRAPSLSPPALAQGWKLEAADGGSETKGQATRERPLLSRVGPLPLSAARGQATVQGSAPRPRPRQNGGLQGPVLSLPGPREAGSLAYRHGACQQEKEAGHLPGLYHVQPQAGRLPTPLHEQAPRLTGQQWGRSPGRRAAEGSPGPTVATSTNRQVQGPDPPRAGGCLRDE